MIEVASSGLTLRGIDVGPRDPQAVLFIHAFPLSHVMWEPQIEALKATHRVVAMDIRGLGASDASKLPSTIDHLTDDVFNVLDALSIESAVICGCSLGGYIAQRAVTREEERFSAVVLCDTRSEADDNAAKLNRSNAIRKIGTEGLEAWADEFVPKLLGSKPDSHLAKNLRALILKNSPETVCNMQMTIAARADYQTVLPAWSLPAFVVVGAEDTLTPPLVAKQIVKKIPSAQYTEIEGAGHLCNLEKPDAFLEVLKQAISVNS